MIDSDVRELLADIFEEEALMIGGLVATYGVDDEFVWRMFRNLDAIRCKALRRLEGQNGLAGEPSAGSDAPKAHAAIEEFLARIGRN